MTDPYDDRLKASLFAYATLIALLIAHVKRDHPEFDAEAARMFDEYLGRNLESGTGLSENAKILARASFQNLLRIDPLSQRPGASPGRPTLRRTFLNWLERG